MGAINRLIKRWGYVRLDQFGLTLTAEGRVISTRPAVLDDGFGGRIVGWEDGDLVAMQLEKWPAAPRAPMVAPLPAPVIARGPLPQATIVADAPVVDEDDWEWEIAMARARAAADEPEMERVSERWRAGPEMERVSERWRAGPEMEQVSERSAVVELSSPKSRARKPTTQPMATVAAPKLDKTVPYAVNPFMAENWDESRTPRSVVKTVARESFAAEPTRQVNQRAQSPLTIIPVPKMPRMLEQQNRPTPVVRAPQIAPQRRMAKGTGSVSEDTIRTHAVANDDQTKPSIALPPIAVLPSVTKRVAASQK